MVTVLWTGCDRPAHKKTVSPVKKKTEKTRPTPVKIVKGKVIEALHCNSQPSYSYAVYVPSSCPDDKPVAALLLFDAHRLKGYASLRPSKPPAVPWLVPILHAATRAGSLFSEPNNLSYTASLI